MLDFALCIGKVVCIIDAKAEALFPFLKKKQLALHINDRISAADLISITDVDFDTCPEGCYVLLLGVFACRNQSPFR
jgi:hypothetical protein